MYSKCSEKMGFESKDAARKAVTVAKYQRDISLKAYRCTKCPLWHLSSSFIDESA